MSKKQDEKHYTISPHLFCFHKERMKHISNTSLMKQFIPRLSSQLSGPLNWTYNIQAWDLVTHSVAVFFRLWSSPPYFSLSLDSSYMQLRCHLPGWRAERGSRGFCQCCCQNRKMQLFSLTLVKRPQVVGSSPTWIIIIPNNATLASKQ